jgi:hypothetical protein
MTEVAQDALNSAMNNTIEEWESSGFELDGSKIRACPKAFQATVSGMKEFEKLIKPEFEITERKIGPKLFELTAVPKSAKNIVKAYITLKPVAYDNFRLADYSLGVDIAFKIKEFPYNLKEILEIPNYAEILNGEIRNPVEYPGDVSGKGGEEFILPYIVKNLKKDLKIALAIREYEKKHSKKN